MASNPPSMPRRAWEDMKSFFRRPADAPRRGDSAARKRVAPCPLAAADAIEADPGDPPPPSRPCELNAISVLLHVRRGDEIFHLPPLTHDRNGPEVAVPTDATAEETRLLPLLKDHAVVVSVLTPFATADNAPTGARRLLAGYALEEVQLRGRVVSDYRAMCRNTHPELVYASNTGDQIARREGIAAGARELRRYVVRTRKLVKGIADAQGRLNTAADTAKREADRFKPSRSTISDAERAVETAKTRLKTATDAHTRRKERLPDVKPAQQAALETKIEAAAQAMTTAQGEKTDAERLLRVLREEKTNALALAPEAEKMRDATAAYVAAAREILKAAEIVLDRGEGLKPGISPDVATFRDLVDRCEKRVRRIDTAIGQMETALDAALAVPTASPPPSGIADRPWPGPVPTTLAPLAATNATDAPIAGTDAAALLAEARTRNPVPAFAWDEATATELPKGTDTLQPIEMTLRTAGLDLEWLRNRWYDPRRWFDLASTRREVMVEARSCGAPAAPYTAPETPRPSLKALIHFEAVNDFAVEVQFRGLRWGWSEGARLQARSVNDPVKSTRTSSSSSTVGVHRESSETTHTEGWVKRDKVVDRTETKTVTIGSRFGRAEGGTPEVKRDAGVSGVFYDREPMDTLSDKMKSAVEGTDACVSRAFMNGLFRARMTANGRDLDTDELADLIESLQDMIEMLRIVIDVVTSTAQAGATLAFPFQLEAGVRVDMTVLAVAGRFRTWREVVKTSSDARHYIESAKRRFEFGFELTVFDGKVTLYAGVAVQLLHKYIARIGLAVELGLGGALRIGIAWLTSEDASASFPVSTRLLGSLGVVASANAGPLFVEVRGQLEGALDVFWHMQWTRADPAATPPRPEGKLELERFDVMSEGIVPRFTVSCGSKLKIPWAHGRMAGGPWVYELPKQPVAWLKSGEGKPIWSYDRSADLTARNDKRTQAQDKRTADSAKNLSGDPLDPTKKGQKEAAEKAAAARHTRHS